MIELLKRKRRQMRNRKYIQSVAEKTGWSYSYVADLIEDARTRLGVGYKDYAKYEFYTLSLEEQEEKYHAILEKREKRKKREDKQKEKTIAEVMKVTGWSHEDTEAAVVEAQSRTDCTWKEYMIYKFYEQEKELQNEIFMINESKKISNKYDVDKEFVKVLCNKESTNNCFSEYLRRPWCVNTKISFEEFKEKFADSGKIIYKPLGGHCGHGVKAFEIHSDNMKKLYKKIVNYPEGVVEQYVVQHSEMSRLSPTSVNTVRIVSISSQNQSVTVDGKKIDIPYAAVRMGGEDSVVDNFHSGGMVAVIDMEKGEISTNAADEAGNVYEKHPGTDVVIKGFKIPYFKEAVELVMEACEKNKIEGYLGWDIAITKDGPVLIEVNTKPAAALLSMPYLAEKKGMKKLMDRYL